MPFTSVSIDQFGAVRQCCSSARDIPNPYYWEKGNTDDILNNKYLHKVRKSFLNNERHPTCVRCWKVDDIGATSFRKTVNDPGFHDLISHSKDTFKKHLDYSDIKYIDITLGNKCNLACRMCQPQSSNLLAKNLKEIGVFGGDIDLDPSREIKDTILEFIVKCKNLKGMYAVGGEPLVNDFFEEIIDVLIENKMAKNVSLCFNTNLQTNKIDYYIDKWSKFKDVRIATSIDGEGSTYEYIRWPGKFEKILKIHKEIGRIVDGIKFHYNITTTMQNLNAHNYYDMMHSELEYIGRKKTPFFFLDIQGLYQLNLVPNYIIEAQILKLESMDRISENVQSLINTLKSVHKSPVDIAQVHHFFKTSRQLDENRKQNLFKTMPWFLKMADEYNIELW